MKILAVYREEIFSNRAVAADRAILNETLSVFQKKIGPSCEITAVRAENFSLLSLDFYYDLIFSMAQDESVLTILDLYESRGAIVLNSSKSIRNCYRQKLSELLCDEAFAYPQYITVDITGITPGLLNDKSVWVKRGDFHALVDDDVIYVDGLEEKIRAIDHFKKRGVEKVLFQDHCEGELFKFYGVTDSFFNLRYMGRTGKDRYQFVPGDINIDFDRTRLEDLAHRAARILELDFFGGDCIIDESGKIHFIDFNDWPSFRTCVHSVAPVMVDYALIKLRSEVDSVNSFVQRI